VFQLFQDLETFNLDDYRQFDDGGTGVWCRQGVAQEACGDDPAAIAEILRRF